MAQRILREILFLVYKKENKKALTLIFRKYDRPYLPKVRSPISSQSTIALIFLSADRTLRAYQSKTTKYLF